MKLLLLTAVFIGAAVLIESLPPPVISTLSNRGRRSAIGASTKAPSLLGRRRRAVAAVNDQVATVLRADSEVKSDSFQYVYETDNGISAQASGSLKKVQPEGEALAVQGQYQYTAPDGTAVQVNYEADESGYHPSGPLIPTPPPVPEAIARSLAYIAAHPPPVDKRQ